jgi:Protein of unknown function (DUF1194)
MPQSTLLPVAVDVALVLAIDVSGSMSEERLRLQLQGYIDAFRSADLARAVAQGPRGRIAATLVEWSDYGHQDQTVGWTLIADQAGGRRFADAIAHAALAGPGWTSLSGAIGFSARLLAGGKFRATRRVIDISGDGVNNDGPPPALLRDRAVAAGITINGLPIVELDPALADYYRTNVVGGPDSFVEVATDLGSFAGAVLRKLIVEVSGRRARRRFG